MARCRSPRRPICVAHSLLDTLVEPITSPPWIELSPAEIGELEQQALQTSTQGDAQQDSPDRRRVLHLRQHQGRNARFSPALRRRRDLKLIRPKMRVPYFRDVCMTRCHGIKRRSRARLYRFAHRHSLQVYLNMSVPARPVKSWKAVAHARHRHHHAAMMISTWYGMNFKERLPELDYAHAVSRLPLPVCMVFSTLATYLYFKKKKWF